MALVIACVFGRLGRLTWWQWLVLIAFGVLVAVVTYLSGGTLTAAAVAGLGSAMGTTLLACFNECSGRK